MAQYLAPGVYIEEMPGPKPFQAVGTATGAFIGIAEKGPIGMAQPITNWTQFIDTFGGFIPAGYLAYAVNQFFSEGGTKCWVVRTCHYDYQNLPAQSKAHTGQVTLKDNTSPPGSPANTLKITALTPGSWSDHVWIEVADALKDPSKFRLVVWCKGVPVEPFEELSKGDVVGKVNATSQFVRISHVETSLLPPARSVSRFNDRGTSAQTTIGITALDASVNTSIVSQANDKFGIIVFQDGTFAEKYMNLSLTDMEQKVNGISSLIRVKDLKSTNTSPSNLPAPTATILSDRATPPQPTLAIIALKSGLSVDVSDGTASDTFKITVNGVTPPVVHDNLTIANAERTINSVSPNIYVVDLGNQTNAPLSRPAVAAGKALSSPPLLLSFFQLAGGDDGLAEGYTFTIDGTSTGSASLLVNAFRDGVKVKISDAGPTTTAKFKLTVVIDGSDVETYDLLLMDTVENKINGTSQYIEILTKGTIRPHSYDATDIPTGLKDMDFIGDSATQNGLYAFDTVDDINILAIPDRPGDREVIIAAYTYCQNRKDCFFVADSPFGLKPAEALDFKQATGIFSGNAFNSSYAALYYPWLLTTDPVTGGSRFVPPSGAVAGTYSSTDVNRGVHKAPAGAIDGYLNSAIGIELLVTKGEQELLNPDNINVIRSFPGTGIVVWGARTLSADPEWRYVNVRRLLLYIEETIDKNTQWVVFEPNDQSLWARLKRDVSAFLTDVWRSGALFGTTAEEAFFVKIDPENNPPEVRDAGRLVIDIGVAPVKPAEFVVFRITQQTPKK